MIAKESNIAANADIERAGDEGPESDRGRGIEMEKVRQQVDGRTFQQRTIENDLGQHQKGQRLASPDESRSANGLAKTSPASMELSITSNGNQQGASSINGARKSSSASHGAATAGKSGRMRHFIALFALSSIVMANMNRQVFNQALRLKHPPGVTDLAASTTEANPPVDITTTNAVFDYDDTRESNSSETLAEEQAGRPVEIHKEDEGFEWTKTQVSFLQSGFSYGYTFFMIPGGRMSEIYGAKWVIFISTFGSALCSLSTPFLARTSYELLVASRVLLGLCQTGISPAIYALCSRWLTPEEASVYLPMIKVGVMIGFMSGSLLNGFLHWRTMFYLVGFIGLVWSALWVFYASSTPKENKFTSEAERDYIKRCLVLHSKPANSKAPNEGGDKERSQSAPWLRILKNPVVLAFTFTKFTVKLSTDTQSMQLPMYLREVFQVSEQLNGILNAANYAIQGIFTGIVAYVAKEMVVREQFGLKKTGIRRLFQGANCFGMGLAYLLISFNMGSLELVCCAIILLSITSMFGSGGEAVLPIDLTTEYSASIMAIANSLANFSGIVLPPTVAFLLGKDATNADSWKRVWWFVSGVMASGGLAFVCVVKAKIQGFNEGKKVKKVKSEAGDGGNSWTVVEMESKTTVSHL